MYRYKTSIYYAERNRQVVERVRESSMEDAAAEFGISESTVRNIVKLAEQEEFDRKAVERVEEL